MKKISAIILFVLLKTFVGGQVPQGISYQAIAFDAGGLPVVSSNVGIRISILDNSTSGPVVYSETHIRLTNNQGLFNLNIGQGSPVSGLFSSIDWAINEKYLKVELDPAGGTNYVSVGTNQLMSVPYALYSENTNSSNITSLANIASKDGTIIVVYTSTNGYGFTLNNTGTPTWYAQGFSGTVLGAISTDSSVVIYTSSNAYGFMLNGSTPTWYSQGISGTPLGIIANCESSVVLYTSSNVYGFTKSASGTPGWYSQGLSGTPIAGKRFGRPIQI
jgi:hypothetical protein